MLIVLLSIYTLSAIFAETVFELPAEISKLLQTLDTVICFIFLSDFFIRLYRAESRTAFCSSG